MAGAASISTRKTQWPISDACALPGGSCPDLAAGLFLAAKAGAILALQEVANAFAAPGILLPQGELVGFGGGKIERGLGAHFQREAVAFLASGERIGVLAGNLPRERHDLALEICKRVGGIDQADLGGVLTVKGAASHGIEQRIARAQEIGQRLAHTAAGEVLEVHFGE